MPSKRFTGDSHSKRVTSSGVSNARSLRHGAGLLALVLVLMFGFAPIADAHTDFESSDPTDGSVITGPVSEIRVRFTAESIVAGNGFVAFTPTGEIVSPDVTVSPDEREFTLRFDPPLVDGTVGVQWSVRAGDAHPIEGTFSFTTTATAIAAGPEPAPDPASSDPASSDLQTETAPELQAAGAVGSAAAEAAPQAAGESEPLVDTSIPEIAAGIDGGTGVAAIEAGAVTLDDFLNVDDSSGLGGPVGFVGRLASQAGSLIAIGVVAFALLVSKRSPGEMRIFVNLVRQAGVVTAIGAIVEAAGLVMSLGSVSDALFGSAGFAVLLRLVGAAGLIASTTGLASMVEERTTLVASRQPALVGAGGVFSGAVGGPESQLPLDLPQPLRSAGATLDAAAPWMAALLAFSYVFDGHTVTKGDRLITGFIHLVHVGGGAIWLGGLVCLLVLSKSRRYKLEPGQFVEMVVRFSVVAAVALAAVGAAGLALTVVILDSVSELWSTAWGRLLIAKVLTVAVAVAAGAFNHFVLVPEMNSLSAHDDARQSFLRTLKIEVVALGCALVVTAALVAAAS